MFWLIYSICFGFVDLIKYIYIEFCELMLVKCMILLGRLLWYGVNGYIWRNVEILIKKLLSFIMMLNS